LVPWSTSWTLRQRLRLCDKPGLGRVQVIGEFAGGVKTERAAGAQKMAGALAVMQNECKNEHRTPHMLLQPTWSLDSAWLSPLPILSYRPPLARLPSYPSRRLPPAPPLTRPRRTSSSSPPPPLEYRGPLRGASFPHRGTSSPRFVYSETDFPEAEG